MKVFYLSGSCLFQKCLCNHALFVEQMQENGVGRYELLQPKGYCLNSIFKQMKHHFLKRVNGFQQFRNLNDENISRGLYEFLPLPFTRVQLWLNRRIGKIGRIGESKNYIHKKTHISHILPRFLSVCLENRTIGKIGRIGESKNYTHKKTHSHILPRSLSVCQENRKIGKIGRIGESKNYF